MGFDLDQITTPPFLFPNRYLVEIKRLLGLGHSVPSDWESVKVALKCKSFHGIKFQLFLSSEGQLVERSVSVSVFRQRALSQRRCPRKRGRHNLDNIVHLLLLLIKGKSFNVLEASSVHLINCFIGSSSG